MAVDTPHGHRPGDERPDGDHERLGETDQAGGPRDLQVVHWRILVLLYAGRPKWSTLATDIP